MGVWACSRLSRVLRVLVAVALEALRRARPPFVCSGPGWARRPPSARRPPARGPDFSGLPAESDACVLGGGNVSYTVFGKVAELSKHPKERGHHPATRSSII